MIKEFKTLEEFIDGSGGFIRKHFLHDEYNVSGNREIDVSNSYRSYDYFKKFLKEAPELDKELVKVTWALYHKGFRIQEHKNNSKEQKEQTPYEKYWEAYKIMVKYITDEETKGDLYYLIR